MKRSNKRSAITAVLLFLAGIVQAQSAYDLQQRIDYALKNNVNVINAGLDQQMADAQVRQTMADGLPQINGNIDLAYNFKVPTSFLPAILIPEEFRDPSTPPDGFVPVNFSTKYTGAANISAQQMIFNGSYFVGLQAARTFTQLSYKKKIQTEIEVIEVVTKAYYNLLIMKEREELVDRNYARLDSLLNETQIMFDNGFAEKIDINRVKVQFNNISVQKQNFDNMLALSNDLLKFQMGMPLSAELQVTGTINDIDFRGIEEQIANEFNYDDRIEYQQLETNRDLVDLDIKNTRVQYLPRFDAYGTLGATSGAQSTSELFDVQDNWFELGVVGLKMNLPIFDGFRKSNMIQQKKIQRQQIDNSFEQMKNAIDLEIRQGITSYESAVDNMVVQKENMELAEEVYRVAKIKYEEGVGSNIEITNADADYKEAQTNYYDALYAALVAKVDLEKAYGKLRTDN